MSYIGQFANYDGLSAAEVNSLFPMTVLSTTTTQSISTATATTLTFANVDTVRDSLDWHDGSGAYPARITVTISGIYLVDANVTFSGSSGTGAYLTLVQNTSTVAQTAADLSGSGPTASLSLSHTIALTAGDYIYVAAYQNSGSTRDMTAKMLSAILVSI